MGECASAAHWQLKCLSEGGSISTSFSPAGEKKKKQKNLNLHVQKAESSLHSDRMYTLLPWIYGLDEFMRLWTGRKVKFW